MTTPRTAAPRQQGRVLLVAACLLALAGTVAVPATVGGAGLSLPARISLDTAAGNPNGESRGPVSNGDASLIAFVSDASDLVAGDTNGASDVFVRDTTSGTTVRASVAGDESQANGASTDPAMSPDGRFVVFSSEATNLAADDTNGASDVFLRDLVAGTTTLVSANASGAPGDAWSSDPQVSDDGSVVGFTSWADDLVPDVDALSAVYARDIAAGNTARVSAVECEGFCEETLDAMSPDGSAFVTRVGGFGSTTMYVIAEGADPVELDSGGTHSFLSRARFSDTGDFVVWASTSSFGGGVLGVYEIGGSVEQVSVPTEVDAIRPDVSNDGRYIAYAGAHGGGDALASSYGNREAFVLDRNAGEVRQASARGDGTNAHGNVGALALSADGAKVAFDSDAPDLVATDTNAARDVFTRDRAGAPLFVLPGLLIGNATIRESLDGSRVVTIPVTLDGPSQGQVVFHWSTADGTAVAPDDYLAADGYGFVAAGERAGTFSLRVQSDMVYESTEFFAVQADSLEGATLSQGTGYVIIRDGFPTVGLGSASPIGEGDAGQRIRNVPIVLSYSVKKPVTVTFHISGAGASAFSDFFGGWGFATVAPGSRVALIPVVVYGDQRVETDERVEVRITRVVNGRIDTGRAVRNVVILDDD